MPRWEKAGLLLSFAPSIFAYNESLSQCLGTGRADDSAISGAMLRQSFIGISNVVMHRVPSYASLASPWMTKYSICHEGVSIFPFTILCFDTLAEDYQISHVEHCAHGYAPAN